MKVSKSRVDLENARLEQPVLKQYSETVSVVPASATTTLDISTGNVFQLTQNTDITTLNITNPTSAGNSTSITIIRVKDNSATTRNITFPTAFKWVGGIPPLLTQTANCVDIIEAFTTDGGMTWLAFPTLDLR